MNYTKPHTIETEKTTRLEKKDLMTNILIVVILVAILPFFLPDHGHVTLFRWDDSAFHITMPDDRAYDIPYAQIHSLELIQSPDLGTQIDGDNNKNYRYGIWKSDALGEYVLCTYKSFDLMIQINTGEQIYLIGYESEETTQLIYSSFLEYVK